MEESLACAAASKLPERAVVLTFDEGTYDFYKVVWPILKEFGYPATLYLTTYYVEHPYPVPPGIWSYMLWRVKANRSDVNARSILGRDVKFNLSDARGRVEALQQIVSFANSEKMDGYQRNVLSAKLAEILGIDFEALCASRIHQLLRPEEVHELVRDGVSVQMHLRRHWAFPPTREPCIDNLQANRQFITKITGLKPRHFCYPMGATTERSPAGFGTTAWSRRPQPSLGLFLQGRTDCEYLGCSIPRPCPIFAMKVGL